jgi:dinuclear metal center YbgI/SA1388 family protein
MGTALGEVVRHLDEYLRVGEVPDSPNALNGLQVGNSGKISRVAAAVDASEAAILAAIERGCDLLLVHHGLFWDGNRPVTGRRYRRLRPLIQHDVAVYAAHIPLDVHPEVGNNVLLARAVGAEPDGTFGDWKGIPTGVTGRLTIHREALGARLDELLGVRVRIVPGGRERIERIGVVTGGGADLIGAAAAAGLDALITGEGPHHSYFDAMEGGLTVYYGGHYATEVFGVKAVAERLETAFGLPWEFLELPTGF